MKKSLVILLVVCFVMSSFVGAFAKDIPDEVTIGMIGAISGAQALDGQNMQDALKVLRSEINDTITIDGKDVHVNWVYEDCEAKPEIAVNAAQKLVEQDHVIAIVGPNNSSDAIAAAAITQDAEIPLISNTGTNIAVTQVGDYTFRACIIDPFQGKVASKFAFENLGYTKAAVIYDNADAYSTGLYEAFAESFKELGGEIVAAEAFSGADVRDYSAQLVNIKAANPEVVFVPCHIDNIPLILQQIRGMGIEADMLGCDSWDYDALPTLVGLDIIEGAYYITGFSPEAETAKDFVQKFEEMNGYQPSFCSAMMYEAASIVINAIQNAETIDGAGVRDAIMATDLDLPSGHVTFDEERNPIKSGVILQVLNGERVYVTSVAP